MASRKMTFSLDERSVRKLESAAERLGKSASEIVREAIRDYGERIGRLGEGERLEMLRRFDEVVGRVPWRPPEQIDAELRELRTSRRGLRGTSAGSGR